MCSSDLRLRVADHQLQLQTSAGQQLRPSLPLLQKPGGVALIAMGGGHHQHARPGTDGCAGLMIWAALAEAVPHFPCAPRAGCASLAAVGRPDRSGGDGDSSSGGDGGASRLALAVAVDGTLNYKRCRALAENIAAVVANTPNDVPLFLIVDQDIAKSTGAILREELGVTRAVVAVDGIDVGDLDYVDIGRPMGMSEVVPVTVKSLLFPNDGDELALVDTANQAVVGNPKGDVTLVEFFDYNCGYCKRAMEDMIALMKDDPKLKVVLKEFPVLGPGSIEAARVAVAVRMQDKTGKKYLDFHQKLLGSRGQADKARAMAAAKEAGLDVARIEKDLNSDEVKASLEESFKLAEKLGLNGTPSYVIGENVVVGAVGLAALKEKVNTARCGKATC